MIGTITLDQHIKDACYKAVGLTYMGCHKIDIYEEKILVLLSRIAYALDIPAENISKEGGEHGVLIYSAIPDAISAIDLKKQICMDDDDKEYNLCLHQSRALENLRNVLKAQVALAIITNNHSFDKNYSNDE